MRRFTYLIVDRLKEYKIAFRGLGEGKHSFEFLLDQAFFDCFKATEGTQGRVVADVEIIKSSLLMEVRIKIDGKVKATCDRCLGEVLLPVKGKMNLYVKQSEREDGNEDDYIVVTPDEDYLDLSTYLYETYMLNYPMRVVHPEGKCDENMQEVLKEYVKQENEKPTDPRWNELGKLINN